MKEKLFLIQLVTKNYLRNSVWSPSKKKDQEETKIRLQIYSSNFMKQKNNGKF